MKYDNIISGVFISRPNRFIANVKIGEHLETVHVKNTGRCRELLLPGSEVWLTEPKTSGRKTRYDLIAVRKENGILFNIDSQAPNKVVKEWLTGQGFSRIIPEYRYGDSRLDFYMEKTSDDKIQRYMMEVKGCTLEIDGIGYFPDAPTVRGTKHLRELIKAADEGYEAYAAFVIQMDGITEVRANGITDPEFEKALNDAQNAGVKILFLPCHVEPDSLKILEERNRFFKIL